MLDELADGCWHLDCGAVNVYLLEDGDDFVLVDAGTPGAADRIRAAVEETGHALEDVDRVVITHYDYDHVGGLARLTPELSATVVASPEDGALLTRERAPSLRSRKGLFQRALRWRLPAPDLPMTTASDGDTFGSLTAYHTPGHTPGHVAYVSGERDVGFLGDLVRESGGALARSPWILSDDVGDVRASIRSLVDRAPSFEWACPGHGNPLPDGSGALERLAGD